MKKIETFLQKYFGFITLGAYALFAVFALGRGTAAAPCKYYESRKNFYKPMQPYNNLFRILSIFGLLLGAFYRVRRCHTRLVYYVSNFTWFGILIVLSVLSGIFLLKGTILYSAYYQLLPFEERNTYFADHSLSIRINPHPAVFILGYLLAILLFVLAAVSVIVLVDKIKGRIRYENNKKLGVKNPVTYVQAEKGKEEESK